MDNNMNSVDELESACSGTHQEPLDDDDQSLSILSLQYPFIPTSDPSSPSPTGVLVSRHKQQHRPTTLELATFLSPQLQLQQHQRSDSVLTYHPSTAASEGGRHAYSSSNSTSTSFSPTATESPLTATSQQHHQQYFSIPLHPSNFTGSGAAAATGASGSIASPYGGEGSVVGAVSAMGLVPSSPASSTTFSDTFSSLWTNYGCGVLPPAYYWPFTAMGSANELLPSTLSIAAGGEPSASLLLSNNDPLLLNSGVYQHSSSSIHLTTSNSNTSQLAAALGGASITSPFITPSVPAITRKRTAATGNRNSMPRRKPPAVKQQGGGNISGTSASSSASSSSGTSSTLKTAGPRRAGRRPRNEEHDPNMSQMDREKREQRRNRNKEAAARCRARRLQQMEQLQGVVNELRVKNDEKQAHIDQLEKDRASLQQLIAHHRCCLGSTTTAAAFVKPELIAAPSHFHHNNTSRHGDGVTYSHNLMLPPPTATGGNHIKRHASSPTSSDTPESPSVFSASTSSTGSSGSSASIATPDVDTPTMAGAMMHSGEDPLLAPAPVKRVKMEPPYSTPFHPPERPNSLPLGHAGDNGGSVGGGGGAGPISTPSNGLIDTPCLAQMFDRGGVMEYTGLLQGRTGLTPQVPGARSVITPSVTSGGDGGELRQL